MMEIETLPAGPEVIGEAGRALGFTLCFACYGSFIVAAFYYAFGGA